MYRLLLILCLCTSICNAQHIKIGASQLINDTVKVAGVLATDTDCAAVVMHSALATETNPVDEPAVAMITLDDQLFNYVPSISYDGTYMNIIGTTAKGQGFYAYLWNESNTRYELIASYSVGYYALRNGMAMSPDGQFCAIAKDGYNLYAYKRNAVTDVWEALATPTSPLSGAVTSAFSEDGSRFVYCLNDNMYTFNWVGNEYVAANAPDTQFLADTTCLAMSYDGGTLVAGFNISDGATTLKSYKWNAGNNRYEITAAPDILGSTTLQISLASDGTRLLAYDSGNKKSNIYDWDAVDNRFEFVETLSNLEYPTMSADGNIIVGYNAFTSEYTVQAVFYKRISGSYVMMPKTYQARRQYFNPVSSTVTPCFQISGDGKFASNGYATYKIYDDLVNIITPVTSPHIYTSSESAVGFLPGRGQQGDTKTITAIWAAPYLQ